MEMNFEGKHYAPMARRPTQARKQHRRTFIREWRKHAGLTLEQLSEMTGVEPSALSYLERGLSAYTQGTIEKIAEALHVSVMDLISRLPTDEGDEISDLLDSLPEAEKSRIIKVIKAMQD